MASVKRIMVSIPNSLLEELDLIVAREKVNRSELIQEATRLYIRERKRRDLRERLRKGYKEMGSLNVALAEEALVAENEAWDLNERQFAERDGVGH